MPDPEQDPEQDIGPYYRFLGFIALLASVGLAFIRAHHGKIGWIDAAIIFLMAMVCLALIRPTKFDEIIKSIATWLPFTKYQKPE